MHFKIETVKLTNIDCTDNTYRITTETNIDDLTASIKKTGLLNPPLLLENNSEYRIVCGCRRIGSSSLSNRSDKKDVNCCSLMTKVTSSLSSDRAESQLSANSIALDSEAGMISAGGSGPPTRIWHAMPAAAMETASSNGFEPNFSGRIWKNGAGL